MPWSKQKRREYNQKYWQKDKEARQAEPEGVEAQKYRAYLREQNERYKKREPERAKERRARSLRVKKSLEKLRERLEKLRDNPDTVHLYDQYERHKKAQRTAYERKRAEIDAKFGPLSQSISLSLLENKMYLRGLIEQDRKMMGVMNQGNGKTLDGCSFCDTASAASRGPYFLSGDYLRRIAVYNGTTGEWIDMYVNADGTTWTIFQWPGAGQADGVGGRTRVSVSVDLAQERLREFLGDTIVFQYNSCDLKRINDWFRLSGKTLLSEKNWIDLLNFVKTQAGSDLRGLFGRGRGAIVPTFSMTLSFLSHHLCVLDGGCIKVPAEDSAEFEAGLVPNLRDIDPEGKGYSDDALDAQKLCNLFVVIRTVYLASLN